MNSPVQIDAPRVSIWSEILKTERDSAVAQERRRFSNELHDIVACHLNVATLFLAAARRGLPNGEVRDFLDLARQEIFACCGDARRAAVALMPQDVESSGLFGALKSYANRLSLGSQVSVTFASCGTPAFLSRTIENALLRIGREAVTNAMRHASPTAVTIELAYDQHGVALMVTDNGVGFDPSGVGQGLGLHGIRRRAKEIGAELAILSRPGQGTQVILIVAGRASRSADDTTTFRDVQLGVGHIAGTTMLMDGTAVGASGQ